ncbi:NAC domain-containing protein 8 [Forsythia ovata]|uniref:NAC domain-containing protein 8 n=1 Tax=Forsythia ovata TaxID=205694 RepID=A0ABD1WAR1_9LAMI
MGKCGSTTRKWFQFLEKSANKPIQPFLVAVKMDVKENGEEQNCKARISDYTRLAPDDLKKDLEECQDLVLDPANIELDTPLDFQLSQLANNSEFSVLMLGTNLELQVDHGDPTNGVALHSIQNDPNDSSVAKQCKDLLASGN